MKKTYQIIVEFLHPRKEMNPFATYQEASEPYEHYPDENIIKDFAKTVKNKETFAIDGVHHYPLLKNAWVKELYIDFEDLY